MVNSCLFTTIGECELFFVLTLLTLILTTEVESGGLFFSLSYFTLNNLTLGDER